MKILEAREIGHGILVESDGYISPKDNNHIITETWWDGNRLIGKIKLLTSPGYLKEGVISCVGDMAANLLRQGVTLGISSRGVGSLAKSGEYNEVQEDFELVCFDLVSSPSTPGSYLFKEGETADSVDEELPVVETKKSSKSLNMDKSTNLMNRLNNFLSK